MQRCPTLVRFSRYIYDKVFSFLFYQCNILLGIWIVSTSCSRRRPWWCMGAYSFTYCKRLWKSIVLALCRVTSLSMSNGTYQTEVYTNGSLSPIEPLAVMCCCLLYPRYFCFVGIGHHMDWNHPVYCYAINNHSYQQGISSNCGMLIRFCRIDPHDGFPSSSNEWKLRVSWWVLELAMEPIHAV